MMVMLCGAWICLQLLETNRRFERWSREIVYYQSGSNFELRRGRGKGGGGYDLAAIEMRGPSLLTIRILAIPRHLNRMPKLRHPRWREKDSGMSRTYMSLKC